MRWRCRRWPMQLVAAWACPVQRPRRRRPTATRVPMSRRVHRTSAHCDSIATDCINTKRARKRAERAPGDGAGLVHASDGDASMRHALLTTQSRAAVSPSAANDCHNIFEHRGEAGRHRVQSAYPHDGAQRHQQAAPPQIPLKNARSTAASVRAH